MENRHTNKKLTETLDEADTACTRVNTVFNGRQQPRKELVGHHKDDERRSVTRFGEVWDGHDIFGELYVRQVLYVFVRRVDDMG